MALPKDVQDAVGRVDRSLSEWRICQSPWQTIRAHLLSQDAEIERLQSGLAAANERLETTERTLERCKQTLDTTSECWRLDAERLEAAERDARGEREETWEIWEYGMCVAGSDDLGDAQHYLTMYGQDGPVKLVRVISYRETVTPDAIDAATVECQDC